MTDDSANLRERRLILRADATTAGGTGHMMRTLALAQAWIDAGGRACWLVADAPSSLRDRIEAEGIEIVPVLAPAGSPGDAAAVVETLTRDGESMAVIDGTELRGAYLEALADVRDRVLVIDDMAGGADYPVGLLLNQNAHAGRAEYPAASSTRFLLGTRYALLRREFVVAPPPRTTPSVARHVLVTFGGADPTGMTLKTISALRRLPEGLRGSIRVRFIVGAANADGARIEAAAADPDLGFRADVERAVSDMPEQMAWADLAITSGGSTVWELARTGCPALVVETVPVERRLVSGLVTVGLFGHLGPGAELDERTMADEIAAKAEDGAWRAEMTTLGMRLIDGQGARRVVDALADTSRSREEPT
jgi:UDP-2,4-diacetamido-2,4,6-trideoxy-beta-L-altropyranose hydrolase